MPDQSCRDEGHEPLSRERVLTVAIALADRAGIAAVTIRSLASELGLKPMSLYHYVASKEDLLDGIVDAVFAEVSLPRIGRPWKAEMRRRARSARTVLGRHPWALGLLESRETAGTAALAHHDAVIGTLRSAGFSVRMTAHAFALLDSYTYGFVLQEVTLPFDGPGDVADVASSMLAPLDPGAYPHLMEMATKHVLVPGYDFGAEFEYGLAVVLDGIEAKANP